MPCNNTNKSSLKEMMNFVFILRSTGITEPHGQIIIDNALSHL